MSAERRSSEAVPEFRIPDGLNTALSLAGFAGAITLLWLGSVRPDWWWALLIGIPFSYEMLFVYALIHQGQHNCLHSSPRGNYLLGALLSLLFPASFTMIRITHRGHHARNRTDHEMFDLYYPTDNRFLKAAQFYCILIGLFWPIVPIGGLLVAAVPDLFRASPFRRGRNTAPFAIDIGPEQVKPIRREMLTILILFAALFGLLRLRWLNVLILYICFAINWSTRQYVTHAFTRRDVTEGALNLRTGRLMSLILLRGEWDLVHHRYPMAPWNYLPRLARPDDPGEDYLRQYLRQWRGPRPCTEPEPEVIEEY